jgi:hypothetical protein
MGTRNACFAYRTHVQGRNLSLVTAAFDVATYGASGARHVLPLAGDFYRRSNSRQ